MTRQGRLRPVLAFGLAAPLMLVAPKSGIADEAFQRIGNLTSQPIGHYEYCQQNRRDCSIRSLTTQPYLMSRGRWNELVRINIATNSTVEPRTDYEIHGVEEVWSLPGKYGDCEDYVLAKRKALMALGWPAHALLPTVVLRKNGEGHAVLTVRTDRGDFILDNLKDEILRWDQTGYKYLKRVAANHSGRWEDILDSRAIVASIERRD